MMLRQKLGLILLTTFLLVGCESTDVMQQESVFSGIKPRFEKIIWDKDGSQMALISAGSFAMGDSKNEPENWMERSRPIQKVQLDAFYMDIHEVTVGQFRDFVERSDYQYDGN